MRRQIKALPYISTRESLYCVWTHRHGGKGGPLVAVWIDPEMRAFEAELKGAPQDQEPLEADPVPLENGTQASHSVHICMVQ
jgi:hypothetical protein